MGKICWDFPLLGTGSYNGSNDAGITIFNGSGRMESLAREVCQNSIDARDLTISEDEPVKVRFKLFHLQKDKYTMFEEFEESLKGAYNFWENSSLKTDSIMEFLGRVSDALNKEMIPVLMVSDYNTIGLNGTAFPKDETKISYWDLLVNTEGISKKENQISAGSFGIGKNAPFAYSGLSTVFYNTLAKDGGRGFQGVTHLVTTQRERQGQMHKTLPTGKYLYLIDDYTGRLIYPEDSCNLALVDEFKRTEVGTDVAIFGFKLEEYNNWQDDITIAILRNFILAIKNGTLEVEVESPTQKYSISKKTLEGLLFEEFKDNEILKWTRQIYETVTKGKMFSVRIAEDNDLSIYVLYGDQYKTALSRFRSTGMLINTKQEGLPRYSVVVIANDVGEMKLSKTLRESEPPQHNEWKAANIVNNKTVKGRAQRYIRKINQAVQKALDEVDDSDVSTEQMDAGIGNYLPGNLELVSESGRDELRKDIKISEIVSNDGRVYSNNQYESAGTSQGDQTGQEGIRTGETKRKRRRRKKKNQVVKPSESDVKGVSKGVGKVKIVAINFSDHRTFYLTQNKYRMHIKSEKKYEKVYIQFYAGRDDNKRDIINIKNIKVVGKPLMAVNGAKAGPVSIESGNNDLYIEFENSEIMAVLPVFTMKVASDEK